MIILKKKILAITAGLLTAMALTACGKDPKLTQFKLRPHFCFIAPSTQIFHNFYLSFGDAVGTLYLCTVIESQK